MHSKFCTEVLTLVSFLLIVQSQISVSVAFKFSIGGALERFFIGILFDTVSTILILKSKIKGADDYKFLRRQSTIAALHDQPKNKFHSVWLFWHKHRIGSVLCRYSCTVTLIVNRLALFSQPLSSKHWFMNVPVVYFVRMVFTCMTVEIGTARVDVLVTLATNAFET